MAEADGREVGVRVHERVGNLGRDPRGHAACVEKHPVGDSESKRPLRTRGMEFAAPPRPHPAKADDLGRDDDLVAVWDVADNVKLDPANEPRQAAIAVPLAAEALRLGVDPGKVLRVADAGAAAVELNVQYLPGDPHIPGREVEDRHLEILASVKDAVSVPVAVKLSPYFSSTGEMALRLDAAGANGLVLFNRFLHRDIDPESLSMVSTMDLSVPAEGRLPRAWIAILRGRVRASLAGTTGVDGPTDVVKYLLAGADVVMTASALLRHGPAYAGTLLDGLTDWMVRKGFHTVGEVRGLLSTPAGADLPAAERAGYVDVLTTAQAVYRDR